MTTGVRSEVARFAERMEGNLRIHDLKKGVTGWHRCQIWWLLQGLKQEVAELEFALRDDNVEAVESEAADVGNFAMMIADKVRRASGTK